VKATTLGFKNLHRVMDMLAKAVLKPGEDFTDLDHMYQAVWDQARLEAGHVANIIGGFESEPKVGLAQGVRFTPYSKARQQEAVAFLNENVFKTPDWLLPAEILRKVEPTSGQPRVAALQQGMLNNVLSSARMARLQEHEAILGDQAYSIAQLLTDVRSGVFAELGAGAGIKVDPYRRNLQRAYVELLGGRLAAAPAAASAAAIKDDSRGTIRADLKSLRSLLESKASAGADTPTKNHINDLIDQIVLILEPKK
jgi:Met-zincin